jgi:hypothetical protein
MSQRPFARNSRPSPFARSSTTPSPGPTNTARPMSMSGLVSSPLAEAHAEPNMGHVRNQSLTQLSSPLGRSDSSRMRANSARNSTPMGTFAPQFIGEEGQETPKLGGIVEGENDFSGKRYVWLKDPVTAFVRGWVVEELPEGRLLVQCDNGTQQEVDAEATDKVNPAKFDKADDMAELTHLNEPSVIHNLHMRYQADLIYVRGLIRDGRATANMRRHTPDSSSSPSIRTARCPYTRENTSTCIGGGGERRQSRISSPWPTKPSVTWWTKARTRAFS